MRPVTFTIEKLRSMPRPPEYLDELRACALEVTEHDMTFDADAPSYRALKAKYTPPLKVTPREPKQWPLLARALRKLAQPQDRGIGDVVERYAAKVGGDAFKRLYRRLTGADCGCDQRQAILNMLYPF